MDDHITMSREVKLSKSLYQRMVVSQPGDFLGLLVFLFHFVPKNALSLLTGVLVRLELPQPLAGWICRAFVMVFRIDLEEAEKGLDGYRTVEDVFTRRLKPDTRPVVPPVCSPADGFLARSEPASDHMAVQAKGIEYSLSDLVYGQQAEPMKSVNAAWFQTIYLAPHNYHRVHAPVSGTLLALRYLPGELWPVNQPFVRRLPRLFVRNERLVFDFEIEGGGKVHVVMVGALNVGRMVTPFQPELVTNAAERQFSAQPRVHRFDSPPMVKLGDELGTFMLGSTVIVVFDRLAASRFRLVHTTENRPILMGQSLMAPAP